MAKLAALKMSTTVRASWCIARRNPERDMESQVPRVHQHRDLRLHYEFLEHMDPDSVAIVLRACYTSLGLVYWPKLQLSGTLDKLEGGTLGSPSSVPTMRQEKMVGGQRLTLSSKLKSKMTILLERS